MRQKGFTPIIILLVVLLLGVLGYFAFTKGYININLPKPSASNNPVTLPSSSPTPDPTANWKTYTNPEEGITFKYPSDLYLVYRKSDKSLGLDGHIFICENKTSVDENYFVLCGPGMRIQTRDYSQGWGGGCGPEGIIETINIGGFETETCWTSDGGDFNTENPYSNNPYVVGFVFGKNFNKIISKEILSTFKFTQ